MDSRTSLQVNKLFDCGMISPRSARSFRNDPNHPSAASPSSLIGSEHRARSLRRRRSDLSGGEVSRQSSFTDSTDFYGDSFPDLLSSLSQLSVDHHSSRFSSNEFTFKGMTQIDDEDYDDMESEDLEAEDMMERKEEELRMHMLLTSSSGPESSSGEQAPTFFAESPASLLSPMKANTSFGDELSPGVVVDSLNREHKKVTPNGSKRARVRSKGSSMGRML